MPERCSLACDRGSTRICIPLYRPRSLPSRPRRRHFGLQVSTQQVLLLVTVTSQPQVRTVGQQGLGLTQQGFAGVQQGLGVLQHVTTGLQHGSGAASMIQISPRAHGSQIGRQTVSKTSQHGSGIVMQQRFRLKMSASAELTDSKVAIATIE